MATLTDKVLNSSAPPYLTETELSVLLDKTPDSRYAQVKRAVAKGSLTRVRRGLYYVSESLSRQKPHPFELAQRMYGSSYVSLESALSYHGLIPEAVYTTTSATSKRNKSFTTPLGDFTYNKLPHHNFFIGVTRVAEDGRKFFMATPWKALLDYIYVYKKDWKNLEPVSDSLRIELEDLPRPTKNMLTEFDAYYKSKRVSRFIKGIMKEFDL